MDETKQPGRPSDRRLAFLRAMILFCGVVLSARVVQVQVLQHDHWRGIADGQWMRDVTIEPERGDLYDREGRPLAVSVTTCQVGVSRRYVKDSRGLIADLATVLGRPVADIRRTLEKSQSPHIVVATDVVLTAEQRQRLRRWSAITLDTSCSRYYPTDGVGASLIGFYRQDPDRAIATGLEKSLESYLAGQPGSAREIQTAHAGVKLGRVVLQDAVHGQSLQLTIDTELQAICEDRLARAIETTNALSGSVLVLDPSNGDVLAAASWPLMETRKGPHPDGASWVNRNFNSVFEPGSVFKTFSGATLLQSGAVDTATAFDCNNRSGSPYGISNDKNHDYGNLTFAGAFAVSSNVYFAKAVMRLPDARFHDGLTAFGFGQRTTFPYAGQPKGSLRPISQWHGADKPSIAIGQAVSATPLQLGMALCAVANGGTLYAPRCVKEIRNQDGTTAAELPPAELRRVMAPPLAEVMRGAMARVVREGTGVSANLDWITSGGKTGTAQKVREGGRGYTPGAYISSFSGIVPADEPRLVIIAVIDEPDRQHHYASQSAAPLYRDVISDIRRCTEWLNDAPGKRTGTFNESDPLQLVEVPDVLYLRAGHAAGRLASAGLRCAGGEREGMVVQQIPAAGARCEPGAEVTLTVAATTRAPQSAESEAAGALCPDFTGLSNREVRGLAARLGLDVVIEGVGYAKTQDVAPDAPRPGGPVTVTMAATWN